MIIYIYNYIYIHINTCIDSKAASVTCVTSVTCVSFGCGMCIDESTKGSFHNPADSESDSGYLMLALSQNPSYLTEMISGGSPPKYFFRRI